MVSSSDPQKEKMEDWGENTTQSNVRVEVLKASFPNKRDQRRSQLAALGILSGLSVVLVLIDSIAKTSFSKEIIVVILPAFTFFLGRMDKDTNNE